MNEQTAHMQIVRTAYAETIAYIGKPAGTWVGFAELREMAGLRPADFNAAIRALEQQPDVNIVPESNQKMLRPQDREAAVVIGDQPKHVIAIGI